MVSYTKGHAGTTKNVPLLEVDTLWWDDVAYAECLALGIFQMFLSGIKEAKPSGLTEDIGRLQAGSK